MKNKVISLVTPLLRRMVTNERQRQYAIESRKSTNQTSETGTKRNSSNKRQHDQISSTPSRDSSLPLNQSQTRPLLQYPEIDPKLDQYHYNIDPAFAEDGQGPPKRQKADDTTLNGDQTFTGATDITVLQYQINILTNGRRVRPKLTLTPSTCPGFPSLVQHIQSELGDDTMQLNEIQLLGPQGLIVVDHNDAWAEAVNGIKDTEWMDGDVKVIVEVGYPG